MRPPFAKRNFFLRTEQARESLIALVRNLPLDDLKPLQVTVEEQRPVRKLDQNALMWVGPLKDISEQAWIDGKQFSAEVWHEYFKKILLPDVFDSDLCRDGYRKFDFDPEGNRVMIGSTTMLTVKGMAQYLTQIEAAGANLGVQFHIKEQA